MCVVSERIDRCSLSVQEVHGEPAAAAVVPVGRPVHSHSSKPSGSSGPGGAAGVPACHGSALAGFEAFPPRPAHPTLAGSGRPDPQTLPRPGASPGAVRARSASLPAGIRFREQFRNLLCVSRVKVV